MRYVGIDLHKRSLTVCVIDKKTGETFGRKLYCNQPQDIFEFFQQLGEFEAVVEATATYEWLWELLEPIAKRLVLAHPKKVKLISESMRKTDKHDAGFLAWLLSINSVPEAHRPTPRQREFQHLVRHRVFLVRECGRIRVKIKNIFAARNIQCEAVSQAKVAILALKLPERERFRVEELAILLKALEERLVVANKELVRFRKELPGSEKKSLEIIQSVPGAGPVTADVVVCTLGDIKRFSSIKKVTSYAGVVPGIRESDKNRKELGITKEGSRLLRWVLIQAAWQSVRWSSYWSWQFEKLAQRRGKKKAIVAIARRLLGLIYVLLKKGEMYVEKTVPRAARKKGGTIPRSPPKMALGCAKA